MASADQVNQPSDKTTTQPADKQALKPASPQESIGILKKADAAASTNVPESIGTPKLVDSATGKKTAGDASTATAAKTAGADATSTSAKPSADKAPTTTDVPTPASASGTFPFRVNDTTSTPAAGHDARSAAPVTDATSVPVDKGDRIRITEPDGSYVESKKDGSAIEQHKNCMTVRSVPDLTNKHESQTERVDWVYPNAAPRTLTYDKTTGLPNYYKSGDSEWGSTDGLNWNQLNGKPEHRHHMVGLMTFGEDGSFKFVNLSGKNVQGDVEAAHLTAYDKDGGKVDDTANKDNFHAEIVKVCQDYVPKTANGTQVAKLSEIEKAINDTGAPCQKNIGAYFLNYLLHSEPTNAGGEATIDLKTWTPSGASLDSAAAAIAKAHFQAPEKPLNTAQAPQIPKVAPQFIAEQPKLAPVEATPASDNSSSTEKTADSAQETANTKQYVDDAIAYFNSKTDNGARSLTRAVLEQSSENLVNNDNAQSANYLLAFMPSTANEINKDFIEDLKKNPRMPPPKRDIAQTVDKSDKKSD